MVEEMQDEGKLMRIFADLYVERPSQKAIVIGHRGSRLKDVGTRARLEIEDLLGGGSTWICTYASPRSGSAIPSSCASSVSEFSGH